MPLQVDVAPVTYKERGLPSEPILNPGLKSVQAAMNPKSSPYFQGMTIDYVRNGLNEGFEFINPNERDRCGCGESFRV